MYPDTKNSFQLRLVPACCLQSSCECSSSSPSKPVRIAFIESTFDWPNLCGAYTFPLAGFFDWRSHAVQLFAQSLPCRFTGQSVAFIIVFGYDWMPLHECHKDSILLSRPVLAPANELAITQWLYCFVPFLFTFRWCIDFILGLQLVTIV